jgi:hypothetical protein
MKKAATWLIIVGMLFAGSALADTLKNAKVEGGKLMADGKSYTIDTTTKGGKELAVRTGSFDVTGKIDSTAMKIVVESFTPGSTTTVPLKENAGGQKQNY